MDIDFWNHMNNARYARKFEWGRQHFLQRAGLRKALLSAPRLSGTGDGGGGTGGGTGGGGTGGGGTGGRRGVHFGFGALAIRYRREVKLFAPIRMVT